MPTNCVHNSKTENTGIFTRAHMSPSEMMTFPLITKEFGPCVESQYEKRINQRKI